MQLCTATTLLRSTLCVQYESMHFVKGQVIKGEVIMFVTDGNVLVSILMYTIYIDRYTNRPYIHMYIETISHVYNIHTYIHAVKCPRGCFLSFIACGNLLLLTLTSRIHTPTTHALTYSIHISAYLCMQIYVCTQSHVECHDFRHEFHV